MNQPVTGWSIILLIAAVTAVVAGLVGLPYLIDWAVTGLMALLAPLW